MLVGGKQDSRLTAQLNKELIILQTSSLCKANSRKFDDFRFRTQFGRSTPTIHLFRFDLARVSHDEVGVLSHASGEQVLDAQCQQYEQSRSLYS